MQEKLRFRDFAEERPAPSGLDVFCRLNHFSIVTYAVSPYRLEGLIPERFRLDTVMIDNEEKVLLSAVCFIADDFTLAAYPSPRFRMGQINYRTYVTEMDSEARCIWFLATTLDSRLATVSRYIWKLPWHRGKISFGYDYDHSTQRYRNYTMKAEAEEAPAALTLHQPAGTPLTLQGFPDTESGLVFLTHRLRGYYHRRDGTLGTIRVWHKKLEVGPGVARDAFFGFLADSELVGRSEQKKPHSVLVEPVNEFIIYLPPQKLKQEMNS